MLINYINSNFKIGEPIFIDELPSNSKDSLRQEVKRLVDDGQLIRIYNGVYYKPYRTILGTIGRMSINAYIDKKYINDNNKPIGFISGIGLYNKYGFTTQIPSVYEIVSNQASTKQRKVNIDGYDIIIYKPMTEINNTNINELEFLTLMTDIDKYSEIKGNELISKINEYVKLKNINYNIVKKYLPLFPDRVYKNIYNGGMMNELV